MSYGNNQLVVAFSIDELFASESRGAPTGSGVSTQNNYFIPTCLKPTYLLQFRTNNILSYFKKRIGSNSFSVFIEEYPPVFTEQSK